MTEGDTRIWVASSVCEIRNSSRHFRIVLPGWSDNAISPAIFSRSGNCMEQRQFERYISVSKVLSAADEQGLNRHPSTSGECSGSVVAIATKREARTMLVDLRLRLSGGRTGPGPGPSGLLGPTRARTLARRRIRALKTFSSSEPAAPSGAGPLRIDWRQC